MHNRELDEIAEEDFPELKTLILVDESCDPESWKNWAKGVNAILIRENVY